MSIIDDILALLSKLPAEGLELLKKLTSALLNSDDPLRAIQRATAAAVSERTAEEVIKRRLAKPTP